MLSLVKIFKSNKPVKLELDPDLIKRLDMYRSDYHFQLELKEKLFSRLTIYSAFIMASITGNIAMVETLLKTENWTLISVIFIWEIIICFLIFIFYGLICLTLIKVDNWVNSNSVMEEYRNTLRVHFQTHSSSKGKESEDQYVNEQFILYLINQYATCSSIIRDNNIYRQQWIARIVFSTYSLLSSTFINGLTYIFERI